MAGVFSRLPESVMGREIAVSAANSVKAVRNHSEMMRFFGADPHPVRSEGRGIEPGFRDFCGKSRRHVEGKVDGVKFDMSDGVEEGGSALFRTELPARRLSRRD